MFLTKLLMALVLIAGGTLVYFHLEEARVWMHLGLEWIRGMGPVPFFAAMIVLPAFGCPVSAFTFTAGPTFIPQLGTAWVCVLVSLGMTLDLALAYWLARYAARPLLSRLMERMGYRLPRVAPGDHTGLTVLLRVTPGPPLFIQNYLLGLAEVPFKIYILISAPIMSGWALAAVLASDALVAGKGRTAFIALGLVAGLVIVVRMVRKHYARRQLDAANGTTSRAQDPDHEIPPGGNVARPDSPQKISHAGIQDSKDGVGGAAIGVTGLGGTSAGGNAGLRGAGTDGAATGDAGLKGAAIGGAATGDVRAGGAGLDGAGAGCAGLDDAGAGGSGLSDVGTGGAGAGDAGLRGAGAGGANAGDAGLGGATTGGAPADRHGGGRAGGENP
ncbi:MAG: VTT domain-containing protein [Opitutaceae bacterium]|nr:VTT domain-containing protein [Opitutaceae bacterium]